MAGVDNRIVTMKFDNREFERGAQQTMGTLGKLKSSMSFGSVVGGTVRGLGTITGALGKIGLSTPFNPMIKAANVGLSGVGTVLDKLGMKNPFASSTQSVQELGQGAEQANQGMSHLSGGVTSVSGKFLALSTIALTALSNITSRAVNAGLEFAKSFSIAPIQAGLEEYETNLKAIQTVQANTDRPLPEINAALKQLNAYSDLTIYNFGEMAKNVGTFTAAGVDLETSVSAIKGIANMAALSGSNSQQAATAMYQLSQALASGKVGLMDWNSVVNAGMGGKKLQGALAQTAVAMGEIDAAQIKGTKSGEQLTIMGKSFRESIMAQPGEESWLTSGILQNSLAALDGRYSRAALKAELLADGTRKYADAAAITAEIEKQRNKAAKEGVKYTDKQFKDLQALSTSAFEAATKVKTLGQVFDIAKETIGSGWSASFQSIFGNLEEAKALFTGMSEGLSKIIKDNALARNNMLAEWNKKGGRADVIVGLKNAWEGVWAVVQQVSKGFRDVFPKQTADSLLAMSEKFKEFSKQLIPSKETLADIRDVAGGVAAVFHIIWQVIAGVATGFKTLFDTVGGGNGDFLNFAGGVGQALKNFDAFLEKSGIITTVFQGLGKILAVPLSLLKGIGTVIGAIFGGFDEGGANKAGQSIDSISTKLSGLQAVGERIRSFFSTLAGFFGNLGEHIGNALMGIGDMIGKMFTPETFSATLGVINTSLLGAITLMIKSFFNKGVSVDLTGGLFDGIKETLGGATSAFENMQKTLKADILMKLAIAIGVMAVSLLILSGIDPKALTKALVGMGIGFGVLTGAMAVLMKVMGTAGLVQLYVVTSAMTKMAASMLLLAFALKVLSGIPFGDMIRGLFGLGAMLFMVQKALIPMAAGSKGMGKATLSLIALGIALNLMAVALKIMASMSWEEMAKGLTTLGFTLGILAGALKIMPIMKPQAIALIALGAALILISVAMKVFASMSWEQMAKGLIMLAGSLAIISIVIGSMPKTMMLQAAALLVVSAALVVLSGALKVMGSMGWEEIAKGLIVLAGSLIILAVGLNAIGVVGAVGAAALLIAAAALAVLVPVLATLGAMSWEAILKGMVGLAGIFVILGLAGALLAPVLPIILGLGVAMVLLGAGLLLAGAGAFLFGTAFGIIVATATAGIQLLVDSSEQLITIIPRMLVTLVKGLGAAAKQVVKQGPAFARAAATIIGALLDGARKNMPKIADLFDRMVDALVKILTKSIPKLATAGLKMIIALLESISKKLPRIIDLVADLTVKFINGLSRNQGRIINAGVRWIISFMNGLSDAIDNHSEEMGRAGARLATSIVEGIGKGLGGAAGYLADKAREMARGALNSALDFIGAKSPSTVFRDKVGLMMGYGVGDGLDKSAPRVNAAARTLGKTALDSLNSAAAAAAEAFSMDADLSPVITPVLDLSALTQEANKMSSILATAPIIAGVSYQTAADISAMTQASSDAEDGPDDGTGGGGGRGDTNLTLELHSPKPIDSVESYRAGKTLISLAKEALDS